MVSSSSSYPPPTAALRAVNKSPNHQICGIRCACTFKTVNVFVLRLLIDGLSKCWMRFALMGANPLSQYQVIVSAKSLTEMMKL